MESIRSRVMTSFHSNLFFGPYWPSYKYGQIGICCSHPSPPSFTSTGQCKPDRDCPRSRTTQLPSPSESIRPIHCLFRSFARSLARSIGTNERRVESSRVASHRRNGPENLLQYTRTDGRTHARWAAR
jgi:hypothetical protein